MEHQESSHAKLLSAFNALSISNTSVEVYYKVLAGGRILRETLSHLQTEIVGLERAGLLYIDMDSEGKERIIAIEPQIALNALYTQSLWEYMPEEGWCHADNQRIQTVKKLYDAKNYLISELSRQYNNPFEGDNGIKNIPAELSSSSMSYSLKQARTSILGITSPPWLSNISLIWETIKDRIEHRVVYRRLCDEMTLIAFGHKINKRDIFETGVNLVVLPTEKIIEKFFVIDDNEVFVFVPGGPTESFKLELMQVSFPPMIKVFKEKFEALWDMGVSGVSVINFMNELREDFLSRPTGCLKSNEKQVLEGLYDYGKFFKSSYLGIDKECLFSLLRDLEEQGYIFPYSGAELGYLPNVLGDVKGYIISNR